MTSSSACRSVLGPAASKSAGFSLLEVLLALGIFVASAALLSRLVILGIENAEYADLQAKALQLAESRFAELEAGIIYVEDAGADNPIEEDPDWVWTLFAESTGAVGLYLVEIEVSNISEGPRGGYSLSLTRYYFDDATLTEEEP